MKNQGNVSSFTKKIGRAIYNVNVHFNENSKEDFNDKLLRLIQNDIAKKSEPEKLLNQKRSI